VPALRQARQQAGHHAVQQRAQVAIARLAMKE
jgi:hypothetical protein